MGGSLRLKLVGIELVVLPISVSRVRFENRNVRWSGINRDSNGKRFGRNPLLLTPLLPTQLKFSSLRRIWVFIHKPSDPNNSDRFKNNLCLIVYV